MAQYTNGIKLLLDKYKSHVTEAVRTEVASCRPVWNVYRIGRDLICRQALDALVSFLLRCVPRERCWKLYRHVYVASTRWHISWTSCPDCEISRNCRTYVVWNRSSYTNMNEKLSNFMNPDVCKFGNFVKFHNPDTQLTKRTVSLSRRHTHTHTLFSRFDRFQNGFWVICFLIAMSITAAIPVVKNLKIFQKSPLTSMSLYTIPPPPSIELMCTSS